MYLGAHQCFIPVELPGAFRLQEALRRTCCVDGAGSTARRTLCVVIRPYLADGAVGEVVRTEPAGPARNADVRARLGDSAGRARDAVVGALAAVMVARAGAAGGGRGLVLTGLAGRF